MSSRMFVGLLSLVFVVAFAIRLGMAVQFVGLAAPPDANANPDQLDYEKLAYHLSTGEGYAIHEGVPTARRTPGTSLAILPVYMLTDRSYAAARVWFCFLSAATCLCVAWIATPVFGRWVGVVAAGMLAIYPGHAYYAMHFLSETPGSFLLGLAVAMAMWAWRSRSHAIGLFAGMVWGLLLFTRPNLIFILPVAAVLVAACWWVASRKHATREAGEEVLGTLNVPGAWSVATIGLVVCLGMLAVTTPWVARNAVVMDKVGFSTIGGHGLWGSNNEIALEQGRGEWVRTSVLSEQLRPLPDEEVAQDEAAMRYGVEFIRSHWRDMPKMTGWKLQRFFSPFVNTDNKVVYVVFALGWGGVAPFALLGLLGACRKDPVAVVHLAAPFLATLAGVVVFYGNPRFRDVCAPVFIPLAAYGVCVSVVWLASVVRRPQQTTQADQAPQQRRAA